jgi:cytochrome d ubiquinol oxidase subunit II
MLADLENGRRPAGPGQRFARLLGIATVGFIGLVSLTMLFMSAEFRARWLTFPAIVFAAPVPLLVLAIAWYFKRALDRRHDVVPFLCALAFFLLSYIGLGISMWPLIVPPDITIWEAAAPPSTLMFLLVGAAVLVPIILTYTAYVYWLFRGKVTADAGYH